MSDHRFVSKELSQQLSQLGYIEDFYLNGAKFVKRNMTIIVRSDSSWRYTRHDRPYEANGMNEAGLLRFLQEHP